MDKKVDAQLSRIREDIEKRVQFISPVTDADRQTHRAYLERAAQMPKEAFANLYRITDACIGCGICAKVCPKKCFRMDGQRSMWNPEGCLMCMACIHACPMTAIQMNLPERNPKARYRNENISICEIIEANNQWGEECPG